MGYVLLQETMMHFQFPRQQSSLAKLIFVGTIAGTMSSLCSAQSLFAFQGLYAGNGGAFTMIDGNGSANSSSTPFVASHSFTGLDSSNNTQTMTIHGSAWSNSSYGKIHIESEGWVENPYFNSSNSPYFDGTLDENGSPDLLAINGNAGWTDEFTYTGLQGTGYKVNFYFKLDGTVSGDVEAGLNFSTSDPAGQSYNPRTHDGNELWITPFYQVDWNQPFMVNADFYAGLNTHVSEKTEGVSFYSSAKYGNTLTLAGMTVVDANGNEVHGWSVSSASGTNYPVGAVPEPATMASIALGIGVLLRRRKRA
jgi:hypothetical protein